MHLQDIVHASRLVKDGFKKVLEAFRDYKQRKELSDMFKLVNDFDKGDGYDQWL
jgi:hypothetical protein